MKMIGEAGKLFENYPECPRAPGLYLALLHGRNDPDEEMDDWGSDGPLIGPLRCVHTTYALELKIEFVSKEAEEKYFIEPRYPNNRQLGLIQGLIEYNQVLYGDWIIYVVSAQEVLDSIYSKQ